MHSNNQPIDITGFKNKHDKQDPEWYKEETNRSVYEGEVPRLIDACHKRILEETKYLVMNMSQSNASSMRVLSLGCGPGTDLLAAARAIIDNQFCGKVELIGVDRQKGWNFQLFNSGMKNALESAHWTLQAEWIFFHADMAEFVDWCLSTGFKFDLVVFCYVNAVKLTDLVGQKAPQLLNSGGRIFVIDNLSEGLVNELESYYFCIDDISREVIGQKSLGSDQKRPIFMVYRNDF